MAMSAFGPGCVETEEIEGNGLAQKLFRSLHWLYGIGSIVLMKKALRPLTVASLTLLP